MQELEKYRSDFDDLIRTVYDAYQGLPLHSHKGHLVALRNSLSEQRNFVLLKEDIAQQLCLIWIECIHVFKANRPKISARQYLIRRGIWGLRDWFNREMRTVSHDCHHLITPDHVKSQETPSQFKLDLGFLLYGTSFPPFAILSPYERYLIFLKFKEDRTTLEIAHIVQKHRETVGLQLNRIIDKLRSETNDQSSNTAGPCESRELEARN